VDKGASFGPDSVLTGFVSGNSGTFAGITNAFSYNKRLQPLNMSATFGSQTVFSIGYDFHAGNGTTGSGADNGNVWGITNNKDTTRNQTFTYDPLNRLISAQNAGTDCNATVLGGQKKFWGNAYSYDPWGNLLSKTVTKCSAESLNVTADLQNRIHATGTPDYLYDAAGNMTFNATPPTQTYSYDQENRLTGAAGYTYTYDGDGNRVRKSNGNIAANGTLYWYMTPGVVAETDLAGTLKSEYVFFDGERVARRDGATGAGGVFYYFSDHLKTASVITDSAGVIKAESDYYPWGGELKFVDNDSNDYKFTGKKRDFETGLDYFGARYYSNGLARFVTADWSKTPEPVPYADCLNPQTLNLYRYPSNPETYPDRDGHQSVESQRQTAVRQAWKQERARVASGKEGTLNWTAAEKTELLQTGRVSGYQGHHINSVKGHPELAGNPNNVRFVKGAQGNLAEHGGDFRNPTTGPLLSRALTALQTIDMAIQIYGSYRLNRSESQTGLHSDPLLGVLIADVDKAAKNLDPGTLAKTPEGETFFLGKDHIWRNLNGDTLYQDKDGAHIKRQPKSKCDPKTCT
jgi:RHS repeat-associated protein